MTVTHKEVMLPFLINIEDGLPVSDQIIQAVRKAMLTGQLAPGDEFPSVRTLSQELRISPTTAHKVVATLKDAGYLASRPGIGMVVTTPELPEHDERLGHLQPLCSELLKEAQDLHLKFDDVVAALRRAADDGSFLEPGARASSSGRKSKS
jgi:GntR family transcriptional regulator